MNKNWKKNHLPCLSIISLFVLQGCLVVSDVKDEQELSSSSLQASSSALLASSSSSSEINLCKRIAVNRSTQELHIWVEENAEGKQETYSYAIEPNGMLLYPADSMIVGPEIQYSGFGEEPQPILLMDSMDVCPGDPLYASSISTPIVFDYDTVRHEGVIRPTIALLNKDSLLAQFDTLYGDQQKAMIPQFLHYAGDGLEWDIEYQHLHFPTKYQWMQEPSVNCEINSITYFTCNSEKRVLCPYYADANSVKALVSELQTEQDTITTQWIIRATNRFGFKDSLEVTSVVIPRSCNP